MRFHQPIFTNRIARHGHRLCGGQHRRGAMLVLVAVTIVLLLITVAFSVDLAFMQLTRTELRTSTDAAARAATEALSRMQSVASGQQAARDLAALNQVASRPLLLDDADIEFGHSNALPGGTFDFSNGVNPLNAVRINGRRTPGSPSGPVGLLFAGVMGPTTFEPSCVSRTVHLDRDICIVVDRSGSMNSGMTAALPPGANPCVQPHATLSRWAGLRDAVQAFIAGVNSTQQDETLGLASYSSSGMFCGRPYTDSTIHAWLSTNYAPITLAMNTLSSNPIQGWTNISAGLDDGVRVLTDPARTRPYAVKTMVLLTDGIQNRGRSAVLAARDAARHKIVIHTVTFSDEAQQALMQQTAAETGGKHYHAPDSAALIRIFREIALTLPVVMTE